jgi:tetratricopeptide (TPR) repeat protein
LGYLDQVSPLYPNDLYLQVIRGYFHKNEAMALRNLVRIEEFEKSLKEAERVFDTMIRERPNDEGAWNGKGSIEALRGKYQEALRFISRALEINPTYSEALSDREVVLRKLRDSKAQDKHS